MERRLLRVIMAPASILVWGLGLWLAYDSGVYGEYWFLAKMVFVSLLTIFHHVLAQWRKAFEADANEKPARYFRVANEVPTVLMIAIVLLVVLRPF